MHITFLALLSASIGTVSSTTISSTPSQTINGIGASGAWWPIDLYEFPETAKEQAANLIFGDDGLKLTSYRYNLGGGGVFVGNPSRAPETPFIAPGVYNFSADPQGTYFLRKAAEAQVPIITLFVNSAPPAFTTNNRSCGGTIDNASIPGYAQYITEVVAYWRSQSVKITHISPMNEPDNTFGNGNSPCGQEGMIVTPAQRANVVNTLRHALNNAGLQDVGIMADESSATGNFLPEASTWIPSAAGSLAAISHHQYSFSSDAVVAEMGSLGRNLSGGRETWFTEICCFAASNTSEAQNPAAPLSYSGGFDPTMVGGLQLASLIYQAFTQTLDAHFDWWLALSSGIGCDPTKPSCITEFNSNGWNDGLLYYDPNAVSNNNFELYQTKRFFVMKHFSQFIGIGSVRYDVEGVSDQNVRALAFKSSKGWSLIVMNMGSTAAAFEVPTGVGRIRTAFQTSAEQDWEGIQGIPAGNTTLPALSITSMLTF